ncbi:MAG: hypothetical protein KKA81_01930 [Bacteroidetes bacterium]|nr:hypothetical protein [Bacteroidota bacterium]
MENKKKNATFIGGLIFTGCMFIGIGLGFFYHNIVVGSLIGMGTGFIGMAVTYAVITGKDHSDTGSEK